MPSNLIRDGQTRRGFIEGAEGIHEWVRFEYRLMSPETVETLDACVMKQPPRQMVATIAEQVAKHLVAWSETLDGQSVPITAANFAMMPVPIFNRILQIVQGRRAPDPDPSDEPQDGETFESIATGESPAATSRRIREGN